MAATKRIPTEKLSYEEAVAELEALVSRMEKGDLPLEESVEAYRRGMELTLACRKKLDRAEEAIRKLDEEGKLTELKPEELRADSAKRTEPPRSATTATPRAVPRAKAAEPASAPESEGYAALSGDIPF